MWTFIPAALKEDYAVKEQSMRQWRKCIFKESPRDRYGIFLKNFADLRSVQCRSAVPQKCFNMPRKQEADYMLKKSVGKYAGKASEFARRLESEIPGGLTVFSVAPDSIGVRRKLRTTK